MLRWVFLFLAGLVVGGAIAFAAIGGVVFFEAPEPALAELTPAPVPPVETEERKPENCAAYEDFAAPWQTAADAEVAPLHLPAPDKRLARRIELWDRVWGEQPAHVYLLFDKRRPALVHTVVDCRDLWSEIKDPEKADKACDVRLIAEKRAAQKRLKAQRNKPSKALKRAFDNDKALIKSAWANILVLEGKADALQAAKARAAPHMERIEKVFAHVGVPTELSRLAFSESLFQPEIVSGAGAVGAYQFMAPTGRQWLMIEKDVDERLDPLRAAYASASYLKDMNRRFESWPLTLTAYNTGPTRMARLVKTHRTEDIGLLADKRTERNFGFDGQNYYASFYAVVNQTRDLEMETGASGRRFVHYGEDIDIGELARCHSTTKAAITSANPALGEKIVAGEKPVPKGYAIALPLEPVATVAETEGESGAVGKSL